MKRNLAEANHPKEAQSVGEDFWMRQYAQAYLELLSEVQEAPIPENFILLLEESKKSEQLKLMRGQSITSLQMAHLMIHAHEKMGYTYSRYRADHHHNGLDESQLPKVVYIDGDKVDKVGEMMSPQKSRLQIKFEIKLEAVITKELTSDSLFSS